MRRRVSLHLLATVAVALVLNIVCSLLPGTLCYAASGAAAAASGAAAPAHPIPVPAPPPPQTLLTRHVREAVLSGEARSVGRLPAKQVLRFDIVLPLRHEAELLEYIGRLHDPSSGNYHKFLTPEEVAEQYGPSQADWDELVAFAQASGFAIVSGSREAKDLRLTGTVGAIEKAFHVTLGVYQHPTEGRTFYSPDREPTVDLPFQLWHISGLDNYSIPQPMLRRRSEAPGVHSNATTGSCPGTSFCGSDIRAAYYGSGSLTGAGQYVGLLQYHGTELSDLQAYYTNAGQTNNVPITLISTDGTSTSCTYPGCDDTEQTVDMTQALGMAPGLAGLAEYIGSTDTAIISAMTVTTDGFPPPRSIGCSWGWTPADPSTLNPYWETMAAQGQNFFAATGDAGAWPSSDPAWPAEADYVVAVGGTDLTTSSAGGPWASETAWLGSGGGVSPDNIAIPSWQTSYINFATCTSCSTTYRNGPDVSANANNTYYVCADQTTCTENVYGGTSFAAPAWAGYLALANQQAASYNESIGFINPVIYQAAAGVNYGSIFHDITSGSNGYSALPGYDLATGWGSMNGAGLINLLAPASVATSTTLTSSPNPSTAGQSVTFTATVSPSPGTNGLMSFTSNGSAISGCSAAALSGGVATCTTSFSAAGANSIVATYVGALGYAGSTSNTVGQSVLLPSATSLTSSPNASSYGQPVTITATVNTGTPATGTMVFQGPTQGDAYYYQRNFNTEETGVDIGNVVYWFECAAGTQSGVYCYATSDYSTQNAAGYTTILIGDTEAHTLANIVAAINNNQSQCGYTDPNSTDNGYNTCFHNGTVVDNQPSAAGALPPQSLVTATVGSGLTINLVSTTSPGNGSGTCWENYGWEGNSYRAFGNPNIGINLEDFASGFEGTCLSGGTPTATGTVAFTSNGTAIAGCSAVPMTAGVATCVTTMLPLGTDSLAAVYSGDSNYIGSTSNTVSQVVNQAGPGTITVTSSTGASPSVYGQSVTFTASIPGQYGLIARRGVHSEVVTGSVTWSGWPTAATDCGTTTVTAGNPGTATCMTSILPVGTDTVTATYSGDSDHTGGSGSVSQTVNQQAPAISVTSVSPASEGYGQDAAATITALLSWAGGGTAPTASDVSISGNAPGGVYSATSCGSPGSNTVVATVPVGPNPYGVAFDSTNGDVYVANQGSNTVSVINGSTNTVVATVAVGSAPFAVAFDSTNGDVYVANYGSNTVSVINGSTNTVVATVPVGSHPTGVAFDSTNGDVYVVNPGANTVSVISGSTNTVVATVPVGSGSQFAAFDSANGDVYVANFGGTVSVIDGSTNTVVDTVTVGGGPYGIAFDSTNGDVYVASIGNNTVSVIDGSTNTVMGSVPVGSAPDGVAVDSTNGDVYVANGGSTNVTVISGSTNTVVATVAVGSNPYGVAFDSTNGDMYVTNGSSNTVSVINPNASMTCTATFTPNAATVSGTYTMSASFAGDSNYSSASSTQTNNLAITDATSSTSVSCNGGSASTYGQSITCTATITGQNGAIRRGPRPLVVGGNVAWSANTGCGTTAVTTGYPGTATCTTALLPVGSDMVTATYSGDSNHTGGSGSTSQTVNPYTPAISVGAMSTTYGSTTAVTSTILITGTGVSGDAAPTGTVSCSSGSTTGGSCSVSGCSTTGTNVSCTANWTPTGTLADGSYSSNTITATVAADANYNTKMSSPNTVTVGSATSSTSVSCNGGTASTYGQSITCTATITGQNGAIRKGGAHSLVVTGSATWSGNTGCGTTAVTSGYPGTATCTTAGLPVGTDTVTATYSGDSNHTGSSGSTSQTVNQQAPAIAVTSVSPASESYGQNAAATITALLSWTGGGTAPTASDVSITGNAPGGVYGATSCGSPVGSGVVATVAVGSYPTGVAFDSTNGDVYVANLGGNSVSVINGNTNTVVTTVPVGSAPVGVAVDSANGDVYVGNASSNSVSVINGSTNTVVATVPVGSTPFAVAFDSTNGEVYVANNGGNSVSVINGSTNTVVATVAVGSSPNGVAFDSSNGDVYVANQGSNTVSVINGSTNTVVATVAVGPYPTGVAFDATNGDVYVANYGSNTVSVINGSTNTVVATVTVGSLPYAVAFDSANGDVYVVNNGSNTVSVINGSTNTVVATVAVGSNPRAVAFDSTNGDVYVADQGGNSVSVIDPNSSMTCTATFTPNAATVAGAYTMSASFSGDSNYSSASSTQTNNFTITDATSSTSVSCNGGSASTYGQSITCTATITGQNGAIRRGPHPLVVGGNVAWSANTGCGTTAVTSGNRGTATCTSAILPGGADTVTATYSGDSNHTGGSGSTSQTVNKYTPAISVGAMSTTYGSTAVVTSTILITGTGVSGDAAPTGTVSCAVGSNLDGSCAVSGCTSTGTNVSCTATWTPGGTVADGTYSTNTITATVAADANYNTNTSSPNTVTVGTATSGMSVSCNGGSASTYGQSITCTATITGQNGAIKKGGAHSLVVTGSVIWSSNTGCGTTAVTSGYPGTATCSTAALPVGSDQVTATYSGDSNHTGGSGSASQTVSQASTTTTLASSANPSAFGPVNFTATINGYSGIINTVAGNGTFAFSGDGGPATSAALAYPEWVWIDRSGNLYFADQGNYRIRKVTAATGYITTVAGGGSGCGTSSGSLGDGCPATSASLYAPQGVLLDAAGNLYIADQYNERLRVVNNQAGAITIAGTSIAAGTIQTIAGDGNYGFVDGVPALSAEFALINGLALDAAGNIYLTDYYNNRVRVINTQSSTITIAGVAIPAGYIRTIAGNNNIGFGGDGLPASGATLFNPRFLTLDAQGNVYFADQWNNRVRVINTQSSSITVAGIGIAAGTIATIAGNGTAGYSGDDGAATAAELYSPWGVGLDAAGNIYISDEGNNHVRRVDSAGTISTIAGNGTAGYNGDGIAANGAELSQPTGLALDGSGNIYVSNTGSNRVRRIAPAGGAMPTGAVTITDASNGNAAVCTITLSNGTGTCSDSTLAPGTHNLSGAYSGDSNYLGDASTLTQMVFQYPDAATLTSTPDPSAYGESVALTASVTYPGAAATGSFTFTANPASAWSASYIPGLDAGNAEWYFECAAGSTGTSGVCTSTDYSNSVAAGYAGILIGDTVADTAKNVVAALMNNQSLCGYADPTTTDNGYGTCFYNGFTASSFPAPPQSLVSASASGATVTLTANASGAEGDCGNVNCWNGYGFSSVDTRLGYGDDENMSPSSGGLSHGANAGFPGTQPTGTFNFQNGGTSISGCAAVAVSSGQATCTTGTLPLGTDTLVAVYSGDSNYASAASNTVSQMVTQAGPGTITVTSSTGTNPSTYGQSVTFTASIPGQYGLIARRGVHSEVVTGSVTWSGNTGCGTTAVTSGNPGTTTCTTAVLPGGADTVTATYSGDSNHTGGSGSVSQTVNPYTPAISVGAMSTTYGSTAVVTAVIIVTGTGVSGDAAPTGTVSCSSGSTTGGSCSVSGCSTTGTKVSCTANWTPTGTLADGTYSSNTITATVAADANYNTNTSSPNTVTVGTAASGTSVSCNGGSASTYGQSITCTATITGQNGAIKKGGAHSLVVSGTVAWSMNTGCGTTSVTTGYPGTATCTTSILPVGTDTVTATYSGDSNHTGGSGSTSQSVNQQAPTIAVTGVSPASEGYGQNAATTVTATLSWTGGGTAPTASDVSITGNAPGGSYGATSCGSPGSNTVVATVPVGSYPFAVAFDSANGDVYVANNGNNGGNTVSVINGSTNTVVATVPVGSGPAAVAVDSANGDVYVANERSNTVSVINGSTNTVVATVPVGSVPAAVAFDSTNGDVYVANYGSNSVSVINGSTNTVVATVPVGSGPNGAAFDSTNGDVYVANYGSNTVSVIKGSTNAVVATIPVGSNPFAAAFDSTNGDVYVANYGSNSVSVINGGANTVVATVPVGAYPYGVAFDSTNGDVYVANNGSDTVSVIDGNTNAVVATVAVGISPFGVVFNSTNGDVYVANLASNNVSVINPNASVMTCTATFTPNAATVAGTYTMSASFSGDSNYSSASSTQTNNFAITDATSSTSVSCNGGSASTYGQSITCTATITGQNEAIKRGSAHSLVVSGTVAWSMNTGCGTTPVTTGYPGTATCTTSILPVGTDTLTATYSGDSNHTGGSGSTSQSVSQQTPAIAVTGVSPASEGYGQDAAATITALLSWAGGGTAPTASDVSITGNAPGGIYSATSCGSPMSNTVVATLPVGASPLGVAFDSTNGDVYVANNNSNSNSVSVINGSTNTVVATVPVGSSPSGVAFDSTNGDVYVANYADDTVSVINGSTNTVVATVAVGSNPLGVVFDSANGDVYVANLGSNTVSVINGSTNTVVATVAVGSQPIAVAFDSTNGDVYVANNGGNNVIVINGSTNTVVATVAVGSSPAGVAFDAANGDVYVANAGGNTVSVINGSTNTVVATVAVGSNPLGVAFDAANGDVYVANLSDNTVSVINGSTNTVVATVAVGSPYGVAFDSTNGDVYVANLRDNTVSVINPNASMTCTATFTPSAGTVAGTYTMSASFSGDSNYSSASSPQTNNFAITDATSSTSVSCNGGSTSAYGQAITCTATITGQNGAIKKGGAHSLAVSGTVAWSSNTGCGTTSVTTGYPGTTTCTTAILPGGADTVTATYSGDSNHTGSSGSTSQTVSPYTPVISVGAMSTIYGSTAAVTSTILITGTGVSGDAAPTGTVSCAVGSNLDGSCAVSGCTSTGTNVSCTATWTPGGTVADGTYSTNTITATVAADANYNTNTSSPNTVTVGTATSSTSVSCNGGSASTYGQSITCTATITGQNGAIKKGGAHSLVVSGTVAWSMNTGCGTTSVTSGYPGTATCTTAILPGGTDTVTAIYSGDSNHTGGSGSTSQMVNQQAPTIAVTGVSPASEGYGQDAAATITALLSWAGGGTAPTASDVSVTGNAPGGSYGATSCGSPVGNTVVATLPVGASPAWVAFDSTNGDVYVTNNGGNTVSVINGSTNAVVATVAVGSYPYGIAYDSANGDVYVANAGGNTVSVINGSTNTVVATVPVGSNPLGVAFDSTNGDVYVASSGDNTVSVINGSTNTVVATVAVGSNPYGLAFDSASGDVYVANNGGNSVSVINGSTNTVVATVAVGSSPTGVAFDATNGDVYVANNNSNSVSVINGSTNTVITTVAVGSHPYGVAFDATNGDVYVVNNGGNTVSLINGSTNTVVATVAVGSHPYGVAFDSTNGDVYVANYFDNTVSVIRPNASMTCTATFTPNAATVAGTYTMSASFSGDSNYSSASSPQTNNFSITTGTTTTALVSSANPSTGGQTVTFTATVTPAPTYAAGLGSVIFKANGTAIGTIGLLTADNGVAKLNYSSLAPGTGGTTYNIQAVYNPPSGGELATSTSNTIMQTVSPETPATTLAAPSASVWGQTVTLTATVTSNNGGTPTGTVAFKNGSTLLANVALKASGTAGQATASLTTTALPAGTDSVTANYLGSNLMKPSSSAASTVSVSQATSTTAVTSSLNPSLYGQTVSLTATVSPQYGGIPTGTVTFYEGLGTKLGVITLNASGTATLNDSTLNVGIDQIMAIYNGSSNVSASPLSPAYPQTVSQVGTSTVATSTGSPTTYGQPLMFMATVTPASGTTTPSGQVEFKSGSLLLGTGTLNGNGVATITSSVVPGGVNESVAANYLGTGLFKASSGSTTVTVNPAASTTSVVSAENPSVWGQPVTFTATVSSLVAGTATGMVTFKKNGAAIGTATLSAGKATLTSGANLFAPSGTAYAITASYNGSSDFAASVGTLAGGQVVNKAASATVVTSSPNPSTSGASVTLTATVTASSPSTAVPTGTVTFYDGATRLGAATLSGGKATLATTTLPVGSDSITAVYAGTTYFTGSTSAAITQTVN